MDLIFAGLLMERVYNFSPGPAVLPLPVIEEAQRNLVALPGVGVSVLEISHRSKWFEAILAETKPTCGELLGIPAELSRSVLAGRSELAVFDGADEPAARHGKAADYIVTGSWGQKAMKKPSATGEVRVAWDGKADNYNRLPAAGELKLIPRPPTFTSRRTKRSKACSSATSPPTGDVPLVCDASSDFLSRPVPVERYGLIYACAQKNAGSRG